MLMLISAAKCFDGELRRYRHASQCNQCLMQFAVYLPPQALPRAKADPDSFAVAAPVPALYFLSGLTCTDENFMQKAGAQRIAAELGIALVVPDTSPRDIEGLQSLPEPLQAGVGASYYLNATRPPWSAHFQMFDYVVHELPGIVEQQLPIAATRAICGHSMGGHGALIAALKHPERYVSVSALAPVTHPSASPNAQLILRNMLGDMPQAWAAYDASLLIEKAQRVLPMLIDQGAEDPLLDRLMPDALAKAAARANYPITLRMQAGYEHSYFFVASFIEAHLRFHAQHLFAARERDI
jgi:S-formylglutathione hydrolase